MSAILDCVAIVYSPCMNGGSWLMTTICNTSLRAGQEGLLPCLPWGKTVLLITLCFLACCGEHKNKSIYVPEICAPIFGV